MFNRHRRNSTTELIHATEHVIAEIERLLPTLAAASAVHLAVSDVAKNDAAAKTKNHNKET